MSEETEFVTWPERCMTCAYREGTVASRSSLTQLKAQLCALTAEPFYCHEDPNSLAICKGWADVMEIRLKQIERGAKSEESEWRRQVYLALNEIITEFEDATLAGLPYDHEAALRKKIGIRA